MSIDFECPKCGAEIEAPESSAGRRGECPECGAKIEIPKTSQLVATRKSARPERRSGSRPRPDLDDDASHRRRPDSASGSKRFRAVDQYDEGDEYEGDEYSDDAPRGSRRRGRSASVSSGPSYAVMGGIGVAVIALIIVLVVLMKDDPAGPGPQLSDGGATAKLTPSLMPTPPPVNRADFMAALERVATTSAITVESVIEDLSEDLFGGGKYCIELLVTDGITSDDDGVRYRADMFLVALTGAPSQEDLLYSDDPAQVKDGQRVWNTWWNENKDRQLFEILDGGLRNSAGISRGYLAMALGSIRDKDCVPLLFNLLEDKETSVRVKAFSSVKRLLANEAFGYAPDSGLGVLADSVKQYRDWWAGVRDSFDFSRPKASLPGK